ncbi:hypothetical protein D3C74_474300 [compost metagenome]
MAASVKAAATVGVVVVTATAVVIAGAATVVVANKRLLRYLAAMASTLATTCLFKTSPT